MKRLLPLYAAFLLVGSSAYEYERGPVLKTSRSPCPGLYCGRAELDDTRYGSCGRCPRGWRVGNNTHSLCEKCAETPEYYDWFYLTFMASFVLILHWISIDASAKRRKFTPEVLLTHFCALVEAAIASALSLLFVEPFGSLEVVSCRYRRLGDWYTMLHNPNPNYEETLRCTQEAVYPLYTIIFVFYALCVGVMLLLRPLLTSKVLPGRGRKAIYSALYFIPVLAVLHSVFGGLIYVSFPYIAVILSVMSSASHFAFKLDQTPRALLLGCVTDSRNSVILLGHWAIHAFGILAITRLREPALHLSLLALVPLPTMFYIATSRFSDPANFNVDLH